MSEIEHAVQDLGRDGHLGVPAVLGPESQAVHAVLDWFGSGPIPVGMLVEFQFYNGKQSRPSCPGQCARQRIPLAASSAFVDTLEKSDAVVLIGPRAGSRTPDFQIPSDLPPGELRRLIDVRINRVESLRPGIAIPAASSNTPAAFDRWREFLVTGPAASVDMTSADGEPMLVSQSRTTYLAGWPNPALLKDLVSRLADRADLATQALPEDIRVRDNGPIRYIFNYGPEPVDISALVGGAPLLLGETMLKSCGVAACEKLRRGEQASRRSGCLNDPPS